MPFRPTSLTKKAAKSLSFGFSGAGFLTCYHLGAAKCLLDKGCLELERLVGVSGGALATAAVMVGVDPEIGMQTNLDIARETRLQGGYLDALRPGFSLIDLVEKPFLQNMLEATGDDVELLQRRLHGVKNSLRIGLTNRTVQPLFRNPKAYCYVDQYRDAQDIVAVCMLSSFVPGGTGLFSGSSETIVRSSKRLREMVELGFVKKETPDGKGEIISLPPSPVVDDENESTHEESEDVDETSKKKEEDSSKFMFIDGGLSNVFPIYDSDTVVVTPFCGIFDPNPSICPKPGAAGDNNNLFRLSHRAKIYKTRQNAHTLRRMAFSSDEIKLQERYTSGYDDAKRFLSDNNLLKVHSVVAA